MQKCLDYHYGLQTVQPVTFVVYLKSTHNWHHATMRARWYQTVCVWIHSFQITLSRLWLFYIFQTTVVRTRRYRMVHVYALVRVKLIKK